MTRRKGLFRIGLGLASALLGALIAFRGMNATATAAHPVRPAAQLFGFAAILLVTTGCYGFAVRGFTNRLARLAMLFGVTGCLGASFAWFLPAPILCACVALTALWLLLRNREGRCHLAALVIALLCEGIGTALLAAPYAAANRYFRDIPWMCLGLGLGMLVALAGVAGVAFNIGSRLIPAELMPGAGAPSRPQP